MVGAAAVGVVAVHRGEPINALWLVVAATCCYALGYRFYSKFIAAKILAIDSPSRHSRRASRKRPRFPRHQQVGRLRTSLRRHRRARPPGWPRSRRAVRISTRELSGCSLAPFSPDAFRIS